jgi:nucleoid-associated protein EbfC
MRGGCEAGRIGPGRQGYQQRAGGPAFYLQTIVMPGIICLQLTGWFDRNHMTNFQQLFQLGQQVQARLTQLQTELGNRVVTTSSGGGMVTVTADGKGRVREIRIDASVVDPADVEMLEDLVLAAVTEAQQRAEQVYEEEMKKVAGGFPLPFNLPNFP